MRLVQDTPKVRSAFCTHPSLLTSTLIEDFKYIFGDEVVEDEVDTYGRAVYDWTAEDENQISFPVGAKILISKQGSPDDWWVGTYQGQTGAFPGTRSP